MLASRGVELKTKVVCVSGYCVFGVGIVVVGIWHEHCRWKRAAFAVVSIGFATIIRLPAASSLDCSTEKSSRQDCNNINEFFFCACCLFLVYK